jgi:hypothetical protein
MLSVRSWQPVIQGEAPPLIRIFILAKLHVYKIRMISMLTLPFPHARKERKRQANARRIK